MECRRILVAPSDLCLYAFILVPVYPSVWGVLVCEGEGCVWVCGCAGVSERFNSNGLLAGPDWTSDHDERNLTRLLMESH